MVDFLGILKKYWGYDAFRTSQEDVVRSVWNRWDTLVLMPTGGGKSLTYQVPAMAMDGVCVVVTPLIALMKDQTDALRRRGISAVAIHAGMSPRQIDIALDNCVYGDCKFLYVSPERTTGDLFRARFTKMRIALIAVDEAHCISQWGYDFRPAYLRIGELRDIHPEAPVLALTASATPAVVDDIFRNLRFASQNMVKASFARQNLSYVVRHTENKPEHLLRVINSVAGSGIVYVRTRERTEKIAEFLNQNGITAEFYHGGMGYAMRGIKQDKWLTGKTRVMVATNAFGMGIDKPDVRFVVHFDICDSLEAYYQEAGRAGRDGGTSYAVMLTNPQDIENLRRRADNEFPPTSEIKRIYEALCNYLSVAIGDGRGSIHEFNIYKFCAHSKIYMPTVVNALKILQLNGYMTLTDESDHPPRITFTVGRDDLYRIRVMRPDVDELLKVVLRSYTGLFSEFVAIDEAEIAYLTGYTPSRVHEILKTLWQQHIIKYIPGSRSALIIMGEERLSTDNIRISPESYRLRRDAQATRAEVMAQYAENDSECRSLLMQKYFGEQSDDDCRNCDVCRPKRTPNRDYTHEILSAIPAEGISIHNLTSQVKGEIKKILSTVNELTNSGIISQTPEGVIFRNKEPK